MSTARTRRRIIAALEVNRINFFDRDELAELDAIVGFGFETLKLLFGNLRVLALGHLKAAHQFVALEKIVKAREKTRRDRGHELNTSCSLKEGVDERG